MDKAESLFAVFMRSFLGLPDIEDGASSPEEKHLRDGACRRGRAIRVALFTIAAVLIGVVIAYLGVDAVSKAAPESWAGRIRIGATGLSLSLLIAELARFLLTVRRLEAYVANGGTTDLVAESIQIGTTAFAVALGVLAIAGQPDAGNDQPLASKEIVYLMRQNPTDAAIEYFPYTFELATEGPDSPVGTELSKQQKFDLARLVSSLLACVGTEPALGVEIEVRGYADANEFSANSDELNRQVAVRRAKGVHDLIADQIASQGPVSGLVLRGYSDWPKETPRAMTKVRYFNARSLAETKGPDQGLFNRRADVVLFKIGACERLSN